jgi:uncharacterized protein (TIGR01619 family)
MQRPNDPAELPSSRWVAFPCTYEKHRALITADAALHSAAPDRSRPFCLEVTANIHQPNPDGMPVASDMQKLLDLEARLAGALAEQAHAVAAGSVTVQGRRAMYFYLPAEPQMNERFIPDIRAESPFVLRFRVREDPEWSVYRDTLYPNLLAWNFIRNHERITRLKALGDDVAQARRVRHYAYFPSDQARRAFAEQAGSKGLTPANLSDAPPGSAREDFGVCLEHDTPVEMSRMTPLTEDLTLAADRLGGDYDGWECESARG